MGTSGEKAPLGWILRNFRMGMSSDGCIYPWMGMSSDGCIYPLMGMSSDGFIYPWMGMSSLCQFGWYSFFYDVLYSCLECLSHRFNISISIFVCCVQDC